MKTFIVDLNNWMIVKLMTDTTGMGIKGIWDELLQMANGNVVVVTSDSPYANQKRRELYPEYKKNRKPHDDGIYENINWFKQLLVNAPSNIIISEAEGYEADDLIAYWTKKMDGPIEIISTDRDLSQLCVDPRITCMKPPKVDPKYVRLYKTLVGDPSDNIKGLKGFGEAAWEKLSTPERLFWINGFEAQESLGVPFEKGGMINGKEISAEGMNEILVYWKIVGFLDIPEDKIKISVGSGSVEVAEEEINKFYF